MSTIDKNMPSFVFDTGNYNTCVVGKSSTGKSGFIQSLALSALAEGRKIVIFEIKNRSVSYEH